MFSSLQFEPFLLSFQLAALTSAILFLLALPLAWWLSQTSSRAKPFVEAISSLPLVLPPSVLGFYLLWAFSYNLFGIHLSFSFSGLVVASCIYSLPFMVQPLQSGFESLNRSMIEASYIAGKSVKETIFKVALPNMKPSLISAIIITFAHTVGEFGVVLMVGGSIPGETRVASVAIYDMVEIMDYSSAHIYSAILLTLSFTVLVAIYSFNAKTKRFGI